MEILTENAQQVNAELLGADLLPVENFVTVIEPNRIVIQGVTRGGQEELRLVLGSTAEGSIDYAVDLRVGQAREIEMPGTTANNSPASAQSLDDVMARWSDDGWMAVLDGSATEAGGSGGGEDWYRFTTESAETISLTMLDEDSLPADSYFELIDAAGAVISRSAPRGDVLELSGYRAEAEETLYIRVVTLVEVESYTFFVQRNVGIESIDTTPAASQVIDADMAWVGNLRYADEFEQEVSGEDADEATDHYRLTLQAADRVTLRTRTPGADTSGTGAPSNTLDPAIRITRPDGFVIGSNDNGAADGMNAELVFTAALSGWYTIEVSATAGEGAYVLEVDGATSPTESFEIVSSSPAAGERLSANQPRELLLRFSDWLDLRTIAPEELFIDGLPGQTMSVVDGKTIRVGLAGVYGDGAHEVALPADRWWSLRGVANDAWQSSFVVDAVGPQVVSFVTGAVNELAAGHLQATITFSEPIDPATVSSQSVQLTGALRGAVALDVLAFDVGTHSLVVAADELGPDVYTLRLSGGIGPIADLVGNALDGEAMGANDGIPSGDGMIGGDFEWSWVVDSETANGSAVELGELARVVPLGSGIRSYRDGNQALHSDTDVDTFTWHSVPGEVNWVVIRPLDPLAVMSAVFVGATEVSYAGRAGESLLIEQVAGLAGEVTLGVTGDRATLYAIDIYQNIQGFATVETQDDVRLELSGSDPELRTFVAAGQANPDEGFYQSQHFTIDLSDHVGSNVTIVWQFERTPTVYGVFEFLEPGASAIVGYQRWGDGYSDIVDDRLQVTNLPIVVAGDYLVRVSMSESIPYRVWGMIDAVPEWGDGRADMRRLNDMPVVSGYVGTAESDVYQVDMVAGQQISLTAMSWHLKEPAMELPEVRPQILLYGPAGELLETSNTMPDGEDRLSYQVMADARYRIEIRGRDVPGEYVLLTELSSVEGDFNGDYYLGCEDLGRLQSAIDAGDTDPEWDVNGDGEVTGTDVLYWVQTLKGTLVGDANLDFAVDVRDLNQWLSHRFTAATSWCDGDFNADGVVDAVDFNLWDAEKFRRA
jgi:hypothetical protein